MPLAGVIGHASIVSLLRHAVAADRVPQSLLFGGPDGVGKRTVALALAQAVNCPKRTGDDACGKCPTCTRIARGQHTDVTTIDRGDEASIKIDVLRDRLLSVVGYRPFESARRVFIIDEAERMGVQGQQDSLLKTLEEPPRHALIILVTSTPDTLRPTVQSRCRRLRFGFLTTEDVTRVLVDRCGIDRDQANLLASVSGGSVSRALAAEAGNLTDDRAAALDLLAAAAGPGLAGRLRASASLVKHGSKRRDREALRARLAAASSLLRDLGALATAGPDAVVTVDQADALRRLAPAYGSERASAGFATLVAARDALDRNASPKIVADWVAVTI
jgi:DNA polymerase-3 subunit delta'